MNILLIEDAPALAEIVRFALEREGHTVTVAPDGITGLAHALAGTADAVLLDLVLPGLPGIEVLRRMRAAGVWTPVLVSSARDGASDEEDVLALGADGFLPKPFSWPVLLGRLRALRGRERPPAPAGLTCR
ncbi:response regulator receiver domain-containing protein [Prauserella shujinwangii]|uniref:Response regulator receiver domain-containing protein n=1 Tax=Prauserella shujinwangii TaxID=1453103 RepID=A0A2T0LQ21_9PSEU|nr:response regulator [Prauserella shujinwangii]PRX45424.1 response regulator receiver domain-containing protein [Prauserella shujinwangii]